MLMRVALKKLKIQRLRALAMNGMKRLGYDAQLVLEDLHNVMQSLLDGKSIIWRGDNIIPLNEETEIALPSDENECSRLAVSVVIPSFNLHQGTFDRPNFGPQTSTKHVEANTIEHATITHVHHHYGGDENSEESPSTSGATAARPKQELEEGFVQVTDDIFMNTKKPLKEGIKIYEGYQEHVTGQRQLLAIKAIIPYTEKSIREVQHLVTLTPHPNVVRIIWSKEQQTPLPTLYIAMELCGSKNLHDYLNENRDKNTKFDFKKTMSYSKRLVKAMKHIHHHRIIHGDVKPENILFSLDGDQIKISDFGISKALRQSHNATKMTRQGTDGYRAPETYNSEVISIKADIFSLGVTLYSLWTNGRHPFGEDSDLWMYNIKKNRGRDFSGLPEEMGAKRGEFLELLNKMLELDPKKRPTIEEISKHPFLSSSQITAQAFLTRQLSLETSPEEALPELPFVALTTPDSALTFEETRPKQGREAIMQRPDLSPGLENTPEKVSHHVLASAQIPRNEGFGATAGSSLAAPEPQVKSNTSAFALSTISSDWIDMIQQKSLFANLSQHETPRDGAEHYKSGKFQLKPASTFPTAQHTAEDNPGSWSLVPNYHQKRRAENLVRPATFFVFENNAPPGVDQKIKDEKREKFIEVRNSKRLKLNEKTTEYSGFDDATNTVKPADFSSTTDKGWVFGGATQSAPTFRSIATATFTSLSSGSVQFPGAWQEGDDCEDPESFKCEKQFKPVLEELPPLIEVKTGEEGEEVVFKGRCKLYRYDKDAKAWKERGVGDIKILHNDEHKLLYRVVMRRDQFLNVIANHVINETTNPKLHLGSIKLCSYSVMDYSESKIPILENIAICFENEMLCKAYMDKITEIKNLQEPWIPLLE